MYLVILAFDNLNFRQWAVRYKAIRHIFLSLREDPPTMVGFKNFLEHWLLLHFQHVPSHSGSDNLKKSRPKKSNQSISRKNV